MEKVLENFELVTPDYKRGREDFAKGIERLAISKWDFLNSEQLELVIEDIRSELVIQELDVSLFKQIGKAND